MSLSCSSRHSPHSSPEVEAEAQPGQAPRGGHTHPRWLRRVPRAKAPSALRAEGAGQWVAEATRAAPAGCPAPTWGDRSGGRSGKVCATCFHDTGRLFMPSLHWTVERVPITRGSPGPSPPCVSAGFYVALEGSAASRGQGAGGGGSGRTLPVPQGGKWNPRRRGPTRSISQDPAMLVPRTARPEAPRTPASSVDEDKVDSPAAQVQMRQESCSRLGTRRARACAETSRVFRNRGDADADRTSVPSADCGD